MIYNQSLDQRVVPDTRGIYVPRVPGQLDLSHLSLCLVPFALMFSGHVSRSLEWCGIAISMFH